MFDVKGCFCQADPNIGHPGINMRLIKEAGCYLLGNGLIQAAIQIFRQRKGKKFLAVLPFFAQAG